MCEVFKLILINVVRIKEYQRILTGLFLENQINRNVYLKSTEVFVNSTEDS